MSIIKNAQLRYRVIDRAIRNEFNPFPNKQFLREKCEDAIYGTDDGQRISDSTIEKDLFAMRMEHDAPIEFSRIERGYYYSDTNYCLDDIPLTEDDIDAIKFAANILFQFKGIPVFKQYEGAIDKILDRV
ncbi:MAG: WYL domain-containing protein, partial [Erythrobacteraceae bacterium]